MVVCVGHGIKGLDPQTGPGPRCSDVKTAGVVVVVEAVVVVVCVGQGMKGLVDPQTGPGPKCNEVNTLTVVVAGAGRLKHG